MRSAMSMAPRSIRYTTARASLPKQTAWAVQQREENMRLDGKIGLVTAAASGMGRAGALRFAREGAAVGVVDLDAAGANAVVEQIKDEGGQAIALAGDL